MHSNETATETAAAAAPEARPDTAVADPESESPRAGQSDERWLRGALRKTLSEVLPDGWRLRSLEIAEVRRQLRKRIVFCRIAYDDRDDGRCHHAELVAKLYGGAGPGGPVRDAERGGRSLAALQQLWDAGFRPPANWRVPRPYGYSAEHDALLQGRAVGSSWGSLLGVGGRSLAAASARAAEWLVALQRAPLLVEPADVAADVARVRRFADELAASHPRYARRLGVLANALGQQLDADGLPGAPSHGDYHPQNVYLAAGVTTVIDFDTFARREPAADVGYALGQALIMSYVKHGDLAPGARAGLEFWRRYEALGGAATWPRVAVHAARSFVFSLHYELAVLRNGRVALLDLWLDLAEECLRSAGPATLEGLARPSGLRAALGLRAREVAA